MSQSQFKITVEDGTMIEVKVDKAKKNTIGIIHLFHGMAEHMDRYDELVNALNIQGYDVLRHNHRGHGKDIDEVERGHFESMSQIADDAYEIVETLYGTELIVPYVVLGHSMELYYCKIICYEIPRICKWININRYWHVPEMEGCSGDFRFETHYDDFRKTPSSKLGE